VYESIHPFKNDALRSGPFTSQNQLILTNDDFDYLLNSYYEITASQFLVKSRLHLNRASDWSTDCRQVTLADGNLRIVGKTRQRHIEGVIEQNTREWHQQVKHCSR